MVLGKRTRNSTASLSSSVAALSTGSSSTSKSTISTPPSSDSGSPAPCLKRARTRSSSSLTIDSTNNKENIAPANWFVNGRGVDDLPSSPVDDEDLPSDEEPESRPAPTQARVSRTLARRSSRAARRSEPTPTITVPHNVAPPDTPPATPVKAQPTPSWRLSKLTITPEDAAMDVDPPAETTPTSAKPRSVFSRVRTLLRCNSESGPCPTISPIAAREPEQAAIEEFIHGGNFLSETHKASKSADSSLYISGSPGTGKTALVTDIMKTLAKANCDITPAFIYVNCMGLSDVKAVWTRVWEELLQSSGGSVGSKLKAGDAKKFLQETLQRDQSLRCILVLDELDFISRIPSALSDIYQLTHKYPDTLRLIGISNTLTLGAGSSTPSSPQKKPSRTASSTYHGPQRSLNFSAYTAPDLQAIINKRLSSLEPEERTAAFNPAALTFLCKKVAATNGDVRYALSVLRRCIDSAEREASEPSSSQPAVKKGRVEMKHVLESLRAHESGAVGAGQDVSATKGSGTSRTVRSLGLHARLVLVAILLGQRRCEASLPLSLQSLSSSSRSPTSSKLTSSSLYTFYTSLLTATIMNDDGEAVTSTPLAPVSRTEFQDIVGVLETSGLIAFSTSSSQSPGASASSSMPSMTISPLTPPKTPKKPRGMTRTTSANSFTPRSGKRNAASAEPCVVLSEGVREEEVVRGFSSTNAEKGQGNAMEREVERLWERESKKIGKDIEKRDRKRVEAEEKERLDALAFED